jgi:hypothetical protein
MPKRGYEVHPLSEKVKGLNFRKTKTKSYAAVGKVYVNNESSIHETMNEDTQV